MKIDLVGAERRGFAMGMNEFSGYLAVALSAFLTGEIAARFGLRPEPILSWNCVRGSGLLAGVLADRFGMSVAIASVGGLTLASGFAAAIRMPETLATALSPRSRPAVHE